jgi:hypothetical protein
MNTDGGKLYMKLYLSTRKTLTTKLLISSKAKFSYKVYLHPSSNKKITNFENRLDPYCRGPQR